MKGEKKEVAMINTIKVPVIVLAFALLIVMPKLSYASDDQHGRDDGRHARHGDGFHAHSYPEVTLVSGMETIDSRVLVAADPDPTPEEIDQPATQVVVMSPVQTTGSDMDTFIVNVPNNKGGFTPVPIRKLGNAYLGPQGEMYYPFPQVSQLKVMYGI